MDKEKLSAKLREVLGRKTRKFRKDGLIPAVVYGKGIESKSLWVEKLEMEKFLRRSGESTIIDLRIEGGENLNVIINEIQRDPVRDTMTHIDFFRVRMDEKIETDVPLEFVGESAAVKEQGGMLVKSLDELPIKCFPADLPSEISVDISTLKTFEDRISVADLELSDKIEIMIDPETVVAIVEEPRSQEEIEALDEKVEEDVSKVEGIVKEEAPSEGEKEGEKKE